MKKATRGLRTVASGYKRKQAGKSVENILFVTNIEPLRITIHEKH